MKEFCVTAMLLLPLAAFAQLGISVAPPKIAGQKAVVRLALTNGLPQSIQSARAAVFLLDPEGKMVGQGTRWIIGGREDRPGLEPGATNVFNFVVAAGKPLDTNVTAKVMVNRVVLQDGKLADVEKDVKVETEESDK